MIKAVTILDQHDSKKRIYVITIAIASILMLIGGGIFFYTYQKQSRANENEPMSIQSQPSQTSSVVSWKTTRESVAVLEYGVIPDPVSFTTSIASQSPTTEHAASLKDLKPNTTYYFQIRIGDEVFDNGGQYYVFRTDGTSETPTLSPSQILASPVITASSSAFLTSPTPSTASPSATLIPTSTITPGATLQPSLTINPSPTNKIVATPTALPSSSKCSFTECEKIRQNLGTLCTSQEYIKCIVKSTPTPTTIKTPTQQPTATPTSASTTSTSTTSSSSDLQKTCVPDYIQANSCRSFSWQPLSLKSSACTDVYKKYFVQCKSTSWSSTDSSVWYCNQTTTSSDITIPCSAAPTPPPGQSIFCRIRAETETGGATNATDWLYMNTSCATLSSSMSQCAMNYVQSNNCRSWSWDNVVLKDPVCAAGFSKYFLQCTSNGDFTGATGTWHCNKTFTDPYGDFPCYGAPTPADGASLTCRVRAEDAYGTDSHSTSWVSATGTCPTSTPTPTFTPSPTPTNTPTPTPIP